MKNYSNTVPMAKKILRKHAHQEYRNLECEQNRKKKVTMHAFNKAYRIVNSSLISQTKSNAIANSIAEGMKEIIKNLRSKAKSKPINANLTTSTKLI